MFGNVEWERGLNKRKIIIPEADLIKKACPVFDIQRDIYRESIYDMILYLVFTIYMFSMISTHYILVIPPATSFGTTTLQREFNNFVTYINIL